VLTGVADPPVDFAAEGWFPGEAIIQWKETAPYTIPINVPPPIPDSSRLTVAAGRAGHCVIACQAPVLLRMLVAIWRHARTASLQKLGLLQASEGGMQDARPALMLGGRNVMTSWTFEAPHAYLIEVSQVSDLCSQLQRAAPYCVLVRLQGTFEKLPIQSANWSVLAWASVVNNSVGRVVLAHCGMRSLLHRLRPHMAWPAQDSSSTTAVGKYTQRTFTWPVRPLAIGFWYWMRIERTSAELLSSSFRISPSVPSFQTADEIESAESAPTFRTRTASINTVSAGVWTYYPDERVCLM
jgi:hypothetical protein